MTILKTETLVTTTLAYTACYTVKTLRHLKLNAGHLSIFPITAKPTTITVPTSVSDHMLICDNKVGFNSIYLSLRSYANM